MNDAEKGQLGERAKTARLGIVAAIKKTRSGASTASVPVPFLGHALVVLSETEALATQLAAAEARATEAAAEAGKWRQRHGELQQELAEQEAQTLALVQENETLSEALRGAEYALGNCYDVTEWPADGSTIQDDALNRAVAVLSAAAAPAPVAPQQQEGGPNVG